jgi:hypothetical protein
MDEVCFQIGSWSLTLSSIEMLFHTSIACFFPFIIFIEKSSHSFRIFSNTFVSDGVDFMIIIFWTWDKAGGLPVCEITFLSVPHAHFVEIITFRVRSEKTWI